MSNAPLIAELEAAVKFGTAEKRVDTLRRVTALFLGKADQLNEQQIAVFDDVLVHLVQRIESKALVQLSKSLAPVDNAPIELIRSLSLNDDIAVAGPVLIQSKRLSESDLVDIAKCKSRGHLLAISTRPAIPEAVTDVLIARGDVQIHHELARNASAQFSEFGFARLVQKSANDEKLAERLGLRLDIPLELLRRLMARASDLVRSRLLASAPPQHQKKIQQVLASIANEVIRESVQPHEFVLADNIVLELNRRAKLTEAALVEFVTERKYEEMTAALALFCGVKSELIESLLKNIRNEGVIIACKAAKLNWPTVRLILMKRIAHHAPSERELLEAKDSFLELTQAAAQRTIRFMQVQYVTDKAG